MNRTTLGPTGTPRSRQTSPVLVWILPHLLAHVAECGYDAMSAFGEARAAAEQARWRSGHEGRTSSTTPRVAGLARQNLNAKPKRLDDLFVMRKGPLVATCQLWTHAFGWECPLFSGEDMIAAHVYRNDTEIEAFGRTWREALAAKRWV